MDSEGEEPAGNADNPSPVEDVRKIINRSLTTQDEIGRIRKHLVQEFRVPYINRVHSSAGDPYIKEAKIELFEDLVKSLPEEKVLDLYEACRMIRAMRSEVARKILENYIITQLELSGNFRQQGTQTG